MCRWERAASRCGNVLPTTLLGSDAHDASLTPVVAERTRTMLGRLAASFQRRCAVGGVPPLARALAASSSVRPVELRRPFQQKNRKRDQVLEPRQGSAVPEVTSPFVHAWLSAWDEPRAGIAQLRSDVWAMPIRTDIVHRVVTWQRACARQGTSKTKSRSEVRGGGKKPRPQKGQGRSRHGSIRSPIWVGGGHAFPKRPRDFSYKLNSKVVSLGMKTALSDKYRRGALVVMRDLHVALSGDAADPAPSSLLRERLAALGVDLKRQRVMLIASSDECGDERAPLRMASEGLSAVDVFEPRDATVLDLVKHEVLVVSLESLAELQHRLSRERIIGFVDPRLTVQSAPAASSAAVS